MSRKSRTRNVVLNFPARCVICGGAIDGDLSNDHFAPRAFTSAVHQASRIGLVFPAHIECNSRRGHRVADAEQIARAAEMLCGLDPGAAALATANIAIVMVALREHADALEQLRRRVTAAMEQRERHR